MQVLKTDRHAIFATASKAQAAADWMHAQQRAADATPS
jgi:antirestriction protein ArdC